MSRTVSNAYALPGPGRRAMYNTALRFTPLVPRWLSNRYLRRQRMYQTCLPDHDPERTQGDSSNKWKLIASAGPFACRRVLDIGCAEGYFCQEAKRAGAERVVGVDSEFRTVLSATLLARREGLPIVFRVGVFPDLGVAGPFDIVLCMSVLHHMMSVDAWAVLADERFAGDLATLRSSLKVLCDLVAPGGVCLVEMPYKRDTEAACKILDFTRLESELRVAGFANTRILGEWEHARRNEAQKHRVFYAAHRS